jgi:hypothetical protein
MPKSGSTAQTRPDVWASARWPGEIHNPVFDLRSRLAQLDDSHVVSVTQRKGANASAQTRTDNDNFALCAAALFKLIS